MWAIPPNDKNDIDRLVARTLANEHPSEAKIAELSPESIVSPGMVWFLQKWFDIPSPGTDPTEECAG